MNIVFMGTPDFSVDFLQVILDQGHTVSAVVTQPDRPKGRGQKLHAPPVKEAAAAKGIQVLQPEKLSDPSFIEALKQVEPDLFVVVAFSILPKAVLAVPKKGSINVHGSLLPKYRGAAPVQWAVVNGDTESGVTVFLLDEKMDHGPVIEVIKCRVESSDTAEDLFNTIQGIGCEALASALQKIDSGNYTPLDQNHDLSTPARKLKKDVCLIQLYKSSTEIYNAIRGFFPYPVCYSYLDGKMFRIRKAALATECDNAQRSGALYFDATKSLFVKTGDGALQILELQLEGKKAMAPLDFYNGLQTKEGLQLVSQF